MKIAIERDAFFKAIEYPTGIVEKSAISVLNNVLVQIYNSHLYITGTNTETDIKSETKLYEIDDDFRMECVVSASRLNEIVKSIPSGETINLSYDDESSKLKIQSGKSRFTLASMQVNDFPCREFNDKFNITVNSKRFCENISFASSSMASNDSRYYLNGMYLFFSKDEIETISYTVVATDGFRMSFKTTNDAMDFVVTDNSLPCNVIINAKMISILKRVLQKNSDDNYFDLFLDKKSISIKTGNLLITSRVIDGKYPDYKSIIPVANDGITIDRKLLLRHLQQISVVSNVNNNKSTKISLVDQVLRISSENRNETADIFVCEIDEVSPNFEVDVNYQFLQDILKSFNSDNITLKFIDENKPIIVTDGDKEAILMAIRK